MCILLLLVWVYGLLFGFYLIGSKNWFGGWNGIHCMALYFCLCFFIRYFICTIWLNIIFRRQMSVNLPQCSVARTFPIWFLIGPGFIAISVCVFISYLTYCMRTELVPVTLHVDGC
jgi:hypothetical protein